MELEAAADEAAFHDTEIEAQKRDIQLSHLEATLWQKKAARAISIAQLMAVEVCRGNSAASVPIKVPSGFSTYFPAAKVVIGPFVFQDPRG